MQQSDLSRYLQITSSGAARALGDPLSRRAVLFCARASRSASEIAAFIGAPLKKTHYRLGRLVAFGLLQVAGETPRKGRAIKLYRAVAEGFYVSSTFLDEPTEPLRREMEQSLRHERRHSGGVAIWIDGAGRMHMRTIADPDMDARGAGELWVPLHMKPDEARALMAEIAELIRTRTQTNAASRPGEREFLFHAALAPRRR